MSVQAVDWSLNILNETKAMNTLYYAPFSCSLLIHIALEKTGTPYELKKIDIQKGEQFSQEYTALNPQARVPLLVTNNTSIAQSGAILQFLDEQHPEAKLLPKNGEVLRYQALSWLQYLSGNVQPLFNMLFYPDRVSSAGFSSIENNTLSRIDDALAIFDQQLSDQIFLTGDTPYACDYYLFVALNWLKPFNKNLKDFPKLQRFQRDVSDLKEVRDIVAKELIAFS
jgi:glutathione S-transferase